MRDSESVEDSIGKEMANLYRRDGIPADESGSLTQNDGDYTGNPMNLNKHSINQTNTLTSDKHHERLSHHYRRKNRPVPHPAEETFF